MIYFVRQAQHRRTSRIRVGGTNIPASIGTSSTRRTDTNILLRCQVWLPSGSPRVNLGLNLSHWQDLELVSERCWLVQRCLPPFLSMRFTQNLQNTSRRHDQIIDGASFSRPRAVNAEARMPRKRSFLPGVGASTQSTWAWDLFKKEAN